MVRFTDDGFVDGIPPFASAERDFGIVLPSMCRIGAGARDAGESQLSDDAGDLHMSWEIDHVFLAIADLPAAERRLSDFGMAFTERRAHEGQGTFNACAMFENAFFELLGARDRAELRSELVEPLGLNERIYWRDSGACPFGVCFRRSHGNFHDAALSLPALPFPTWPYAPPYVPPGESVPIVTPRGRLDEPLLFLQRPRGAFWPGDSQHRGASRRLTRVSVTVPPLAESISEGARWFVEKGSLTWKRGPRYLLELEWDGERERQAATFDDLCLVVRW